MRRSIRIKALLQLVSLCSGKSFNHHTNAKEQKEHSGFTKTPQAEADNRTETDEHIAAKEISGKELDIRIRKRLITDKQQREQEQHRTDSPLGWEHCQYQQRQGGTGNTACRIHIQFIFPVNLAVLRAHFLQNCSQKTLGGRKIQTGHPIERIEMLLFSRMCAMIAHSLRFFPALGPNIMFTHPTIS